MQVASPGTSAPMLKIKVKMTIEQGGWTAGTGGERPEYFMKMHFPGDVVEFEQAEAERLIRVGAAERV
jgi:hypothetical protein